jgi:hypothetical protein
MIWLSLYDKLGKQLMRNLRNEVAVKINDELIPLILKFDKNVRPYFILKSEEN